MKNAVRLFVSLLVLSCTLLTAPDAALAQATCAPGKGGATQPAQCAAPEPASNGNGGEHNVGAADPINIITGNNYQREVDAPALPGVLGLELVRHYNSVFSDPKSPSGVTGRSWRLSYETILYPQRTNVQIVQADGTRIIFSRDSQDPSICAGFDPADGKVKILRTPGGERYAWTWPSGRVLTFNANGNLLGTSSDSKASEQEGRRNFG